MAAPQVVDDHFLRRQYARRRGSLGTHHRLQTLDHRRAARRHLERAKVALPVEHAIGERLLVTEKMQDLMLDRILANEMHDRHRTRLILAPGPRDALLELGRIP